MAARLSARTRSHNHSPRDKSDVRSAHARDGLARRLQRAVRRSRDRASADGQLAGAGSGESPPRAARSRQRRVIATRSIRAPRVTAPRRSQRLDPPDCGALPPATQPGLSFGRGRTDAGVDSVPLVERGRRLRVGLRPARATRAAGAATAPAGCRARERAARLHHWRAHGPDQRSRTSPRNYNLKASSWCPSNVLRFSRGGSRSHWPPSAANAC